ncbi:glycoside hydrolase family 3 protein [Streptacidiphilus sp. ASG 303]|uniref:glycoside hydrolase family 3 protein n=1 Tax=Streptacidiphilus sp. ASG 303 TaxID=2896847 RepID=UPI001E352C70|nr:glycoside hydrolase family 3 N-terminal domain-containing protein [Streptacidiphilus sp. ASG 303]MCD0481041.1 glycoside hydrolase family 3 protein [Streptacidiphilus sp. ASG 303]
MPDRASDPGLLRLADAVLQPGFTGTTAPDWVRRRIAGGLGSVLLFARNTTGPAQTAALTAQLRAENPDVIVAVDEEGGDVTRLEAATGSSYPGNLALGTIDDEELTRAVARSVGRDLAAAGITLDYAPDADVNSNPRNPVIGVRSFGGDTALVARHTAAWVRGLHEGGAAACAKHFPGHGDTSVDSHHGLPVVDAGWEELAEVALPPFRAAVDAGARAVMTAHLLLPALDPDHPATASRRVLTGLLREELGFDGLVVTDAVEMAAVADRYGVSGAAVRALAAGADLVCVGNRGGDRVMEELRSAVAAAVAEGVLAEERLAEAADRVARFAAWSRKLQADALATAGPADGTEPADTAGGTGGTGGTGGAGRSDRAVGLEAARRALRVRTGGAAVTAPPAGAPHVAEFSPAATVAVDAFTRWGVAGRLAEVLPGTTSQVLTAADADHGPGLDTGTGTGTGDRVAAAAAGRPLVLVVRDAHRHAWMRDALLDLVGRRPDAVVVEMGLPGLPPCGAVHVATHGAARVCGEAAVEAVLAHLRGRP